MTSTRCFDYTPSALFIDGRSCEAGEGEYGVISNPATGAEIGRLPYASEAQLTQTCAAAQNAFEHWRLASAFHRSGILRRAAAVLRERREQIARDLTMDQGKPLAESLDEVSSSADHLDWHAEESRRIYGRTIPARHVDVTQTVHREPVGVVAAFTPWNFPLSQAVRKVAAVLGSGCTLVLKGPENAPSAVWHLAMALQEAGLPPGCLNLVWGIPDRVSEHLLAADEVRCVSLTGSVPVGKLLAAKAGARLKRSTFELGGHAPVIVFDDADIDHAADTLAAMKWRNAGQVCVSPTRFFVHRKVRDRFVERFVQRSAERVLGDGMDARTTMGPLARLQRLGAMDALASDALSAGAALLFRSSVPDQNGWYFPATVLAEAPRHSRVMQEEPFGPLAIVNAWDDLDEVLRQANSLSFGLSGYVFTSSSRNAHLASSALKVGQVGINHWGLALPETPMGGVMDSGWGSEGGSETFEPYLLSKFVSHLQR